MKVWLDTKSAPPGWVQVKSPKEAADLVETGEVEEISVSYTLDFCIFTGLDFLTWLKQKVFYEGLIPPGKIYVHNTNGTTRKVMQATIEKIENITLCS